MIFCYESIPGEQFAETVLRIIGDAGEDVAEPGLGINIVEVFRGDQAEHERRTLAATVRAGDSHDFLLRVMPLSARSAALFERQPRP